MKRWRLGGVAPASTSQLEEIARRGRQGARKPTTQLLSHRIKRTHGGAERVAQKSLDHLGIEVAIEQGKPSAGGLNGLVEDGRCVHPGVVGTRCEHAVHGELQPALLARDVRLDLALSVECEGYRPPPVTNLDADRKNRPDLTMAWRLWTGNETDAELIYVAGREKMQVVDHAVVTTYE